MFFFYDEIREETAERADDPVRIRGAYNLKAPGIPEFEVTCPYGDIVLIIAMLRDYVSCLDEVKGDDISYRAYYRGRFLGMADRLSRQIGYDYDKALKKCLKKREKEDNSDVGEEAMALALKYGARRKKEKENEGKEGEESERT